MKIHNIFIKNVYYMLSYAFLALDSPEFEFVDQEEFDHIHNLFAAVLARGIAYQLKQGLYREYRNHTDELSGLRGKIDLAGSMRLKAAGEQKLSCESPAGWHIQTRREADCDSAGSSARCRPRIEACRRTCERREAEHRPA